MKRPEIRFEGFDDEWEKRKLGDVADSFEYGLNAAAKKFDGENKYIRITDIDDSTHEFRHSDLTSPDINLEQAGDYKLTDGDILFARTGASVGKTYIYRQSDGLVYYAGFLIRARINKDYYPEFVFQNTLTPNYDQYIRITSQRSGQPGVNAQEYAEYEFMVPTLHEQRKIGIFLRKLDNTITLHKRKLDTLQNLKKSMLEKMFPKEGETKPEIRFEGFTDDWEQRKLGDVIEQSFEVNSDKKYGVKDAIGVTLTKEMIPTYANLKEGDDVGKFYIVRPGYFVYNPRTHGKKIGLGVNESNCTYIVTFNDNVFRLKDDLSEIKFMHTYLSREEWDAEACSISLGTSTVVLTWNNFCGMDFMAPSYAEQERIGSFFNELDNLITLYQRKLESLRHLKSALLDKMFV